jgi:hypothetical protein
MFKRSLSKWAAVALPTLGILLTCGCGTPASHPNQVSAFDGGTYNTLLLAHGALTSLQANVVTSYPKYIPIFNQATAAYAVAYNAYASFRKAPATQLEVSVTINNLTVAIVALENSFQTDIQASPAKVGQIRRRSIRIRSNAAQAGFSVSDLLTELEIAAAVANTIPKTSPYARMAELIIQTTSAALAAEMAAAGQPIDLTLIQPWPAVQ